MLPGTATETDRRMRSALSILALVIVLAIVLLSAKHQMQAMKPPPAAASAASAAGPGANGVNGSAPDPAAVGRQVQDLMKQGEQRASEADAP